MGDILGIAVGHVYYFLEDVWPREPHSGGRRYLQTPRLLKWLIESNTPDDDLEIHDDAELPPTAGDMLNNMAENNHESASSSAGEEPAEPQAAST
ncbi:unnamed protein product [Umbelopsis sp. WA50703]